jgi:hypothetical protein
MWGSDSDVPPLTEREVSGLKRFIALGGVLFVDDFAPDQGRLHARPSAKLARVIPEGSPIPIDKDKRHLQVVLPAPPRRRRA